MQKNRKYLNLSFESEISVILKMKELIKKEVNVLCESEKLKDYVKSVSDIISNEGYLYYMITDFTNQFKDYIFSSTIMEIEMEFDEVMNNTKNRIMVIAGVLLNNPENEIEDGEKLQYASFIDSSVKILLTALVDLVLIFKEDNNWEDFYDRCKYILYTTIDEFYSDDYPFSIDYGIAEAVLESCIGDECTCILLNKSEN